MDCSAGTIVWVRRRNGSWWPGRILGPEELSASHLMSPRSGTPVKLLGREDASVDWYNLEKSKRVKAFRCGEFDACIERAEASQGVPIKKREKYARREDAILHALELERHQMEMKHQKLGTTSNGANNKTLGAHRRELNSFLSSENMKDDGPGVQSKSANHKSAMFSRKAVFSHEEEDTLYEPNGAEIKQIGWTDHNPEALPRMRGLQDFGLRIAPPKKTFSQSTWETSGKLVNNRVGSHSNAEHMLESSSHGGGNNSSTEIKRKRSQGVNNEDYLVKKRDRRRPLVQVLQSSAKLPVSHSFQSGYDSGAISLQRERDHMGVICRAKRSKCVYLPADSNDSLDNDGYSSEQMAVKARHFEVGDHLDHTGALTEECTSSSTAEETESDTSESDSSEPDMENGLTDTTEILLPGSRNCDPPAVQISENFGDLNGDEKPHHAYMPLFFHPQDQMMDASPEGVSKWNMKGKRNIRQLPKSIKGSPYRSSRGSSFKPRMEYFHGEDVLKRENHNHLMGFGNQRYPFASQAAKDRARGHNSFNDTESDSHLLSPARWEADRRRVYWDEADDCYNPVYAGYLSDEMEPLLVDVNLNVQAATYQGEHVPLVSLMSRLNGKAIIGHPVQIEIMEDGSTGHLVSKYGADLDESTAPSAVWKTARRSVMLRVPRSNPASALEGEDVDPLQDSDLEIKPSPTKAYALPKKSISHSRQRSVPGKSHKKVLKSVTLSNQKTRTLSSFASEWRLGAGADNGSMKPSRRNDLLNGLINADGAAPIVTCVPMKVVFSRILEAIGRPSSSSAHRTRVVSPAVRDTS